MRVTEKGQVTIPKNVRRKLGIVPGSEVHFDLQDDGALLRRAVADGSAREVADFMDHIRRYKGTMDLGGMTGDEFFRFLRD
jgi:AbrB family looped-hinge helix DNA binding protein